MGYYEGADGPAVVKSAKSGTNGFKKGGKAEKAYGGKAAKAAGGCMKKGGEVMSHAAKGKKPARATGGGVFSSAHSGSPRGKASHY
jgi:hypothetical protein